MKRLQAMGIGNKKKQAELLTVENEEILWSKGLLGDHMPQSLLDTIVYCNGLFFALRSGREHRQLRSSPCQIEVVEWSGERSYLKYTEDISKNHPGGLKGRHAKPKVVSHQANISKPKRRFVRLFKLYRQLCPTNAPLDALYLQPAKKPTSTCWYSKVPLGHTKLSSIVSHLCMMAGIVGYFTNHSLRATATSRFYHACDGENRTQEHRRRSVVQKDLWRAKGGLVWPSQSPGDSSRALKCRLYRSTITIKTTWTAGCYK